MEGLRQPVGNLPPEIYWRRRVVVLAGVALLVVVLWFLITSPSGVTPDAQVTTIVPASSLAPNTSPAPDAALSRACSAADIVITTTPNPRDFAAGTLPTFDVSVSSVGTSTCLLDTANPDTELLITSGSDRIWSSTDCAEDSTINARQFLLQPGASEAFQVTWTRQRSAPGCTTVTAEPRPGTYRAALTIQGVPSEEVAFTLS